MNLILSVISCILLSISSYPYNGLYVDDLSIDILNEFFACVANVCVRACVHVCVCSTGVRRVCAYACLWACMYVRVWVLRACVHVYMFVHKCSFMSICVCAYPRTRALHSHSGPRPHYRLSRVRSHCRACPRALVARLTTRAHLRPLPHSYHHVINCFYLNGTFQI